MPVVAAYVYPVNTYTPAGRISDVYRNGSDIFQIVTKISDHSGLYILHTTAPGAPSNANGGLAWTIIHPRGGPQEYVFFGRYIIRPVSVQQGTNIHVFYLKDDSFAQTYTLCHVVFDMVAKTWGTPDETGPVWSYNSGGDYYNIHPTSAGAVSSSDFIVSINLFDGTTPGGNYERSLFMVRKTSGVWGTPTRVSTQGMEADKTLVVTQGSAIHIEAGSDLAHFFWFQNGGNLYSPPYDSTTILKTRSYNLTAGTFNSIQDIYTYDPTPATVGAVTSPPLISASAVKFGSTLFVAFLQPKVSGSPLSNYAVISGDPTSASPSYTRTVLSSYATPYVQVPRLVVSSDSKLFLVGAVWSDSGSGGFTLATPKLVHYENTGTTTWGAEATTLELATGTGAYPPTANNVPKPPAEQPYGVNGSNPSDDTTHYFKHVYGTLSLYTTDALSVFVDSLTDTKFNVVFPGMWGTDSGADSTHAIYMLAPSVSGGATITSSTVLIIDGVPEPAGTYVIPGGSTVSISCPGVLPPDVDPPFPPVYPYLFSTDTIYGRDHLSLNLKMVRGDTYSFDARILLNGQPLDLTGGTVRMTAKWKVSDADNSAVFQLSSPASGITITDAVNGEITVTVAKTLTESLPAKTVELAYDIQWVDASTQVFTVLLGTLVIVPDVTITR